MLFKKLTKRLFFVVTVLAVGLPFLFSCKNNVEETSSVQEADVPEGKCALSVSPELSLFCDDSSLSLNGAVPESPSAQVLSSVRSAFPDTINGAVYAATLFYEVTDDDGETSTKYLTASGVSDQAILIFPGTLATTDAATQKRFVFDAPTVDATYTLTLYLTTGLDSSTSVNIDENQASIIAKGSTTIELKEYQRYVADAVSVNLELFTDNLTDTSDAKNNKGNCKLFVKVDSSLDGCTMTAKMTRVSDSKEFTLSQDTTTASGYTILTFEEVAENNCGLFTLDLTFTKDDTEVTTNYTSQYIAIMGGMITSAWYENGQKITDTVSVTEGEASVSYNYFTVYKDIPSCFYVKGADGGGTFTDGNTTEGKLTFYTTDNFADGVPSASDTTGDGSMSKPYATIQKAVDRIMKDGNENTEYTIYVDGTFMAKEDDFSSYVINSNGDKKSSVNSTYHGYFYIAIEPKANKDPETGNEDSTSKTGRKIKIKGLGYLNPSESSTSSADAGATDLSYSRAVIDGGSINTFGSSSNKALIFSFGEGATVTLENIAITNAFGSKASDTKRPVIMSSGAEVTLKNCLLDGSNFVASGINSTGGSLDLVNTTISSFGVNGINASKESEIKLTNSTVSSNKASGIKALDTNITLDSCLITKNSTDSTNTNASDGGGIHFRNAMDKDGTTLKKLVIKDTQMTENGNTLKNGGALYISGGKVSLEGTTELKKNTALSGGGIFINPDLTSTLKDSDFGSSCSFTGVDNQTIKLDIAENVKIGGKSGEGNSVEKRGSAIAVSGGVSSLYMMNVEINTYGTIDYNTVTATSDDPTDIVCGAIYIGSDYNSGTYACQRTLNIYGGSISNNSSSFGASALYVHHCSEEQGNRTINIKPADGKKVNIKNNTGAPAIYLNRYTYNAENIFNKLNLVIGEELSSDATNDQKIAADKKINISNNEKGAVKAAYATVTLNHGILDGNGTGMSSTDFGSAFCDAELLMLYINGGKITNNKNAAIYSADNNYKSSLTMKSGYFEGNDVAVKPNCSTFCVSGDVCTKLSDTNYRDATTASVWVSGKLDYTKNPYYVSSNSSSYKTLCIKIPALSTGNVVVCSLNVNTYTLTEDDKDKFSYNFEKDGASVEFDSSNNTVKYKASSN